MENNSMDDPGDEELKDSTKDGQKEDTKPPASQEPQKYPNNLETLRKAKGRQLQPYLIINEMNEILGKKLVVENYDGWEKGEHLPYADQRDALAKFFRVK